MVLYHQQFYFQLLFFKGKWHKVPQLVSKYIWEIRSMENENKKKKKKKKAATPMRKFGKSSSGVKRTSPGLVF